MKLFQRMKQQKTKIIFIKMKNLLQRAENELTINNKIIQI